MKDLEFTATKVEISGYISGGRQRVNVAVDDADTDDILDGIGMDDVIDHFGEELKEAIKDKYELTEAE